MKEAGWGKEPFDLRLTILRMIRCLPGILGLTALCVLLTWGSYYLKNVTFNQEKTYSASATFFVDYADEDWYVNARYFNDYTWNIWLKSDQFLGAVVKYLPDGKEGLTSEGDLFVAEVPADLRVVVIRSQSHDANTATARIEALKSVLQKDFTEFVEEIREIRVVDEESVALDVLDLRLDRALILSLIVSLTFAICAFLVRELMQDKLWLPTSLTDRFGLKQLGRLGEPAFSENLKWLFQGKKKIAVCAAEDSVDAGAVASKLGEKAVKEGFQLLPVACPLSEGKSAGKLREADGILLVVKAGGKNAEYLKLLLSFLEQQDCKVTAAILWEPDNWLLRIYYALGKKGNVEQ